MECDETSSIQKWIYYPESNKQGRIGPDSDQNLCFEQHDYKRWTLQWCDANNTNQLVNGWKRNKRFELFPNGQRERCFSQHRKWIRRVESPLRYSSVYDKGDESHDFDHPSVSY